MSILMRNRSETWLFAWQNVSIRRNYDKSFSKQKAIDVKKKIEWK